MEPKISIHRRRDNVYVKLNGDFDGTSAHELLSTLKRVVFASLKFTVPGSMVFFSFRAQGKVDLGEREGSARQKAYEPG